VSHGRMFACSVLIVITGFAAGIVAKTAWANVTLSASLFMLLIVMDAVVDAVRPTPQENPNE
jgi:hypothetical protein